MLLLLSKKRTPEYKALKRSSKSLEFKIMSVIYFFSSSSCTLHYGKSVLIDSTSFRVNRLALFCLISSFLL